ncbi:MAG: hypothetical protein R3B51_06360 [Thermodesulfobacteriota bacterium]
MATKSRSSGFTPYWALWKLEGKGAFGPLLGLKESEEDPAVLEELDYILELIDGAGGLEASG